MNRYNVEASVAACLVSIRHPVDDTAPVPFLMAQGPFNRIAMPKWQLDAIKEMGFDVTVHEDPYDPVAASNIAALVLADQLSLGAGEPISDADGTETDTSGDFSADTIAEELAPTTVEFEQTPAPDTPPVVVIEQPVNTDENSDSAESMPDDEVAALRARITALSTHKDAKELIAEYGVDLPADVTKLDDIKAYLLSQIDQPASDEAPAA